MSYPPPPQPPADGRRSTVSSPPRPPSPSDDPDKSLSNPHHQATLRANARSFRRSTQPDSVLPHAVAEGVRRAFDAVISTPRSFRTPRRRASSISLRDLNPSKTTGQASDGLELKAQQKRCPTSRSKSWEPNRSPKLNRASEHHHHHRAVPLSHHTSLSPPHSPASITSHNSSSSSGSNWWQFWRSDDTSSGTSSGTSSQDSDSSFFRVHSEFTLMTPTSCYSSSITSSKGPPDFLRNGRDDQVVPRYDSFTSGTVNPALQRLLAFWKDNRKQLDGDDDEGNIDSDLGLQPPSPSPCITKPDHDNIHEEVDIEKDLGQGNNCNVNLTTTRRTFLPKIRRKPLSSMHKLSFGEGGRLHNNHLLPSPSPPPPKSSTTDMVRKGKEPVNENLLGGGLVNQGAWWLDVTCPNEMDMEQLSKIFNLHPLTVEDILIQETREKMQTFDRLGYYFVCFRALDETHFKYVEEEEEDDDDDEIELSEKEKEKEKDGGDDEDESLGNHASLKTARTMRDGIQGVNGRRRKRKRKDRRRMRVEIAEEGVGVEGVGLGAVNVYLVVFGDGIISFHFDDLQKHIDRVKDRIQTFSAASHHISPHWIAHGLMDSIIDAFFPMLSFVEQESDELDEYLADPLQTSSSSSTQQTNTKSSYSTTIKRSRYLTLSATDPLFNRSKMLTRITTLRKLVVLMSRLMVQKIQTVQGLRKRMKVVEGLVDNKEFDDSREIHLYIGDLQDHIMAMFQTLDFYDTLLSNAHLTYLGILRLAYDRAKQSQDMLIVRLYTMSLTVLPMLVVIGVNSMNINIPKNGDRDDHVEADGSSSPYYVFGIVIVLCGVVGLAMCGLIGWIFRKSEKAYGRKVLDWSGL